MDSIISLLSKTVSNLVSKYNKMKLSKITDVYESSDEIITEGYTLLKVLRLHTNTLEDMLAETHNYVEDINIDISDNMIHTTDSDMLIYKTNKFVHKPLHVNIDIKPIKYHRKFKQVDKLEKIPEMFVWYNNPKDKYNKPGIYVCVYSGVYVRVPFPQVVDSNMSNNKTNSIRCKYTNKCLCGEQRKKMAITHNSLLRKCNFAHQGEKLKKIGHVSRCPSCPHFGNSTTLVEDCKQINLLDIKNVLLYGLNDLFSAMVWLSIHNINDKVMEVEHI